MAFPHSLGDGVQPTQLLAPASRGAGTTVGTWIDMRGWEYVHVIFDVGAITATGTIAPQMRQATSNAGAGAKDITGANLTTITDAGGATAGISNSLYAIEFRTTQMDFANSFFFTTVSFVTGVAANITGVNALQYRGRVLPTASNGYVQYVKL